MLNEKSSWSAVFDRYEDIKGNVLYRRMYFRSLSDAKAVIVKKNFFLDERPDLKAIGHLTQGEIVNFYADPDFQEIKFCYPHGEIDKT